ncbi:hypothetical protein B0T26DRAFT_68504 [Lasiosphaeria miniovina]|uniref:Uncharacterized protein n=1 Tax=Lasiosphaeria miniovina TaxID=1954250 RepID=A0AA40BHM8_9PEZI|nr:uncharacterized protein B0T26DRAFT_68504 [Lasiosphaeria miniovina]KAK0734396.1 hypothetical protein B0T26DRAFT_68504 [Lasiosphaeria miniovina]
MKWQALALSFLATTGLASPIFGQPEIYTLRLSSRNKALDGQYLGVNGALVGVFKDSSVVRFIPVPSGSSSNLVELHTYPVGKEERALALVGKQGLLDFSDVVNPAASNFPKGTTCDWTAFRLGSSTAKKTVVYAGKAGGWVAFPTGPDGSDWSVKWKDSSAITIENYMTVDVVYEAVDATKVEFGPSS